MSCYKCGKKGHFSYECFDKNSYKSMTKGSFGSSQVKCFDCKVMVTDLKAHRVECTNSRYSKSIINESTTTTTTTTTTTNSSSISDSNKVDKLLSIKKDHQDVYFLIDCSGSMMGSPIQQAKQSLVEMVNDMNPLDRMAVITFDSAPFFKLKPRPIEEIKRKNELPDLMERIFCGGSTAIYDAIVMAIRQLQDKSQKTLIMVLTDGDDNSSKNTYSDTLSLLSDYPNISLNIIEIGGQSQLYNTLCSKSKGLHVPYVQIIEIQTTVIRTFKKLYHR